MSTEAVREKPVLGRPTMRGANISDDLSNGVCISVFVEEPNIDIA